MKLELTQKLQQQQILAPQMILSMDILLLPTLDLEQRIQSEFAENPALELVEVAAPVQPEKPEAGVVESRFEKLEHYETGTGLNYDRAPRRKASGDVDSKYEALQNTAGRPPGLKETLTQQLHLRSIAQEVQEIGETIINSLDQRGYLTCTAAELREDLAAEAPGALFDRALDAVRDLDPAGVGAENLKDCLLLQLERDPQEYPIECEIIRDHLQDLSLNKLPKIAKDLGKTLDEIKDAVDIISSLDPCPGSRLESEQTIYVRPDVVVEEFDGELEIRVDNQTLPDLQVSDSCKSALKESRGNRETSDFLRKKIESAQWLIQAVQQRQRTIADIARAMVDYQREFMLHGPEHLRAMKMQTLADTVGVHISTISRAIKGKYILTPHGLFDMRYFFTGGVDNADGETESRRNIYRLISEIVAKEDKRRPLSDTALAKKLNEQGLKIARRTVTKYREQEGIPSSRLRKTY